MEENPYKGVPGGDPRLRAKAMQAMKKIVRTDFICAKCGENKHEMLREGKDTTGRKCVDCRNVEQQEKRLAREAAMRVADHEARVKWWKEYMRPQRTEAERDALLEEYKDWPQEVCVDCRGRFHVHSDSLPFAEDVLGRENIIMTVVFRDDPFASEIDGDETEAWHCRRCTDNSAMEI